MRKIKKKIIISLIVIFIIAVVVLISLYISEEQFRDWIDENILRKNITDDDIIVINLDSDKANQVCAYSKYIALLNEKTITLYNQYGEEQEQIETDINTALFDSNDKYLVVAENAGNRICLILDKTYLWSTTTEGEILQIHVNKNGYVAVVTEDNTYKAILTLYNSSGKELFKSYFSSTRIVDLSISSDNKYIAIGELDASGTLIQSDVKIISIDNAQNDSDNAIIYTYSDENNSLITNVEYQNQGQVACMYDDKICVIDDEQSTDLLTLEDDSITFMSIDFTDYIVYINEEENGLFKSSSNINIVNTNSGQENVYVLDDIAKEIYTDDDILAVNVGTELYFFNTNGWLIKKYTGSQEISDLVLSENIAGIIYKDRIVLIDL